MLHFTSNSEGGNVSRFLGDSSADGVSGCEFHSSTNLGSGYGAPVSCDGFEPCWVGSMSITVSLVVDISFLIYAAIMM